MVCNCSASFAVSPRFAVKADAACFAPFYRNALSKLSFAVLESIFAIKSRKPKQGLCARPQQAWSNNAVKKCVSFTN